MTIIDSVVNKFENKLEERRILKEVGNKIKNNDKYRKIDTTIEVEGFSIDLEFQSDHHGDFASAKVTEKETGKTSKKTMSTFPIRQIKIKKALKLLVKEALQEIK